MHLLDINVWLGLAFRQHKHHRAAIAWFGSLGEMRCCFCRLTQTGFLRLASNPQVMGDAAVTPAQAWQAYDALFADPHVAYVEEPEEVERISRALTQHQSFSSRIWNDAYLAASTICLDFDVITFDKGLTQYADLRYTVRL